MKPIRKWLSDVRLWLILFGLFRLYGITQPPLEITHNWRQTTVTMVARNFSEIDANILYPRVDMAGELSGITGMEFPLLNYSIHVVASVFGYTHWYGRLINLLVSSIGLWFFFLTIRSAFNEKLAFRSTLILLFSVWFAYSRKIMPDTFAMSLIISGIYYGIRYLKQGKWTQLLWFVVLGSLGVLAKLPSAYLLVVLIIPFVSRNNSKRQLIFTLAFVLTVVPGIWWYFHWVPKLENAYGFQHFFMGKPITVGLAEIAEHWGKVLNKFYDTAIKIIGFTFFLVGIYLAMKRKNHVMLAVLTLSSFSFLLVVLKAGYQFPHHAYYVIPYAPVMALIAAYGLDILKTDKYIHLILIAICLEGLVNQLYDFRIKDEYAALEQLESDLDETIPRDDLILINSNNIPTPMYFAHRRGWLAGNEEMQEEYYLDSLQAHGLKHVVILKKVYGTDVSIPGTTTFENEHYRVVSLLSENEP